MAGPAEERATLAVDAPSPTDGAEGHIEESWKAVEDTLMLIEGTAMLIEDDVMPIEGTTMVIEDAKADIEAAFISIEDARADIEAEIDRFAGFQKPHKASTMNVRDMAMRRWPGYQFANTIFRESTRFPSIISE